MRRRWRLTDRARGRRELNGGATRVRVRAIPRGIGRGKIGVAGREVLDLRAERLIDVLHKEAPDRRGGATTLGSQKVDFNAGDEFQLDPSYGGIREANLNSNGSDPTYVRPPLAFDLFRAAGNPGLKQQGNPNPQMK